jgi:hypothetical protein
VLFERQQVAIIGASRIDDEDLARRLDEALCATNIEYQSKRSGRLAPVRLALLEVGFWTRWDRERLLKTGRGAGAVQAPA